LWPRAEIIFWRLSFNSWQRAFIGSTSVHRINKGINKPIEFKVLKAQYIGYLAAGLVLLLIMFAVMYIAGVNMFFCLGLTIVLGSFLFVFVYGLSAKYGQYGLLEEMASRSLPSDLICEARSISSILNINSDGQNPFHYSKYFLSIRWNMIVSFESMVMLHLPINSSFRRYLRCPIRSTKRCTRH
jgi:hypothetical protein